MLYKHREYRASGWNVMHLRICWEKSENHLNKKSSIKQTKQGIFLGKLQLGFQKLQDAKCKNLAPLVIGGSWNNFRPHGMVCITSAGKN